MSLNVLVIDRSPPVDRLQGNSLIGAEVFRRLRAHRLTLVAPSSDSDRSELASLGEVFHRMVLVPRASRVPALVGSLEADLRGVPPLPGLDIGFARRLRSRIAELVHNEAFDVVHVRQLPMAPYGRSVGGSRLLELVDSEALGAERAVPATRRTALRASIARLVERRAMRGYDVVTVVADADAARLRRLDPRRRVLVIPNGVDLDRFGPLPSVSPEPDLLVFVGAMSFAPNVVAMQFFCREVLPRVRAVRPDAKLLIVGRDPGPAVRSLHAPGQVEVVGEVRDVRPYLARAAVFVAPILSGSGIKNKVLEAFAAGRAVAATPLAVEGLPVTDGVEARVATGAEALADAVTELLSDPVDTARIGANARRLVERRYTWDACAAEYERLYGELADIGRREAAASEGE